MDNTDELIKQLKRHEGIELKPYKCTSDKLTIGVGRNLEDVGISEAEAEYLLMNDLSRFMKMANEFNWYAGLNDARKAVIISMLFNLGRGGFNKFLKFKQALAEGDHLTASREMLDSRWAKQVKGRAVELSKQMETGKWQQS
jgi:lysozyme